MQHALVCRDGICFFSIFILSQQIFLCRDRSFFGSLTLCSARSIILSILCHNNIMCVCWNSYVTTLTIVLRHCFYIDSSNLCRDLVLCRDSISFGSCCNNVLCIVSIFVAIKKVCCDRILSPLNPISCCSIILMLRHSLLVL